MNSLFETIVYEKYINSVINEYINLDANSIFQINESFKSSLLKALAKAINDAEAENIQRDKDSYNNYVNNGSIGFMPVKSAQSFASLFGPVLVKPKYGVSKKMIQGLKWNIITDNDFKKYNADDKDFIKLLKQVYAHKIDADFICCERGTKNVKLFIKGYTDNNGGDIRVYGFESPYGSKRVTEKTATKNKYGVRSLKYAETLELISEYDIYALVITNAMKTEYINLHDTRVASQTGVVNYDKASLEQMLKQQKARYQAAVKDMKAKKLSADTKKLLDRVNKVHAKAIATMEKVMDNMENVYEYFDISSLLSLCSNAYTSLYNAKEYDIKSKQHLVRAKRKAAEDGEEFDEQTFNKWDYDAITAKDKYNDVDEYCKKVEKMIDDIEKRL